MPKDHTTQELNEGTEALLRQLDVSVEALAICRLAEAWELTVKPHARPVAYYVLEGEACLAAGPDRVRIDAHDFALVPAGVPHRVYHGEDRRGSTGPRSATAAFDHGLRILEAGQGAAVFTAVCGEVEPSAGGLLTLVGALRQPIVRDLTSASGLHDMFEALLPEVLAPKQGTRALIETLLKQSLIHALRRELADGDLAGAWTDGLKDPRLVRVLAAMLSEPAAEHSLESLSSRAGLSRSAFAERFKSAFGSSPMELLREVRLRRAAALLRDGATSVKQAAHQSGFDSRSHFSRAFAGRFGVSPSKWRDGTDAPLPFTTRG